MAKRGRPPHPELLTPRQQEVLSLVREGLSNREIAERLYITIDGAKFHVSEILTKIGVPSRDEAARWRSDAPVASLDARVPRWHSARRAPRLGWRTSQRSTAAPHHRGPLDRVARHNMKRVGAHGRAPERAHRTRHQHRKLAAA